MAGRIKRPCARPGCSALVVSGYCEAHRTAAPKAMAERNRLTSAQRGYGYRWQRTSAGRLVKYPFCADPYELHKNRPEPATLTDHIVPHKGNMVLFWDPTNWQSLCDGCHGIKTAKEDGGFGNPLASEAKG